MDKIYLLIFNFQFLKNLLGELIKFDQAIEWINKEEKLFEFPPSTYPGVEELKVNVAKI